MGGFRSGGPANVPSPPGNGFPKWYQDLNGLVLDFCLPDATDTGAQTTACLLTGRRSTYVFPTTFPDEAFYFRATSGLDHGRRQARRPCAGPGRSFRQRRGRRPATRWSSPAFASRPACRTPARTPLFIRGARTSSSSKRSAPAPSTATSSSPRTSASRRARSTSLSKAAPARSCCPPPGRLTTIGGVQFLSDGLAPIAVTGSRFGTNTFTMCGPFDRSGRC